MLLLLSYLLVNDHLTSLPSFRILMDLNPPLEKTQMEGWRLHQC